MIENRTSVGKSAEDFIRLQDLWGMFFQKWYWFALSFRCIGNGIIIFVEYS